VSFFATPESGREICHPNYSVVSSGVPGQFAGIVGVICVENSALAMAVRASPPFNFEQRLPISDNDCIRRIASCAYFSANKPLASEPVWQETCFG
jgi:hypothetical protein